jgi:hypothetical protein
MSFILNLRAGILAFFFEAFVFVFAFETDAPGAERSAARQLRPPAGMRAVTKNASAETNSRVDRVVFTLNPPPKEYP